jgi:hypothetical protein
MLPSNSNKRSNFPTRPSVQLRSNSFPEDLLSDGKDLYTQIEFVNYKTITGGFDFNLLKDFATVSVAVPVGGMSLPIPKKINDTQTLNWNDVEGTGQLLSIASSANIFGRFGDIAGQATSAFTGLQLNPFLFMVFQRPNFKEFSFSWTFAPKNIRESRILSSIINQFKRESLPKFRGGILDYPNLALIKIHPNDVFGNLKFKPCAVTSVLVDYTGTGPSFFKETKAPTVVNLTVNFKEIQLQGSGDIGDYGYTSAINAINTVRNLFE